MYTTTPDHFLYGGAGPAVVVGDSTNGNWYLEQTYALPLNTRTTVTLECKGADVKLTVGTTIYTAKQPKRRSSGDNLIVYASDPWYAAANAEVYNLDYQILPPVDEPKPLLPAHPVLVRGNQIATIPGTTGNYRLSFEINPLGVVGDWGSIVHFTYSEGNCCNFGDRGPALYLWPGTTQLHVSIGDSTNGN